MFRFQHQIGFLALTGVPLCWILIARFRKIAALTYSSTSGVHLLKSKLGARRRHLLLVLKMIALTLFILALCRPQAGLEKAVIQTAGVDIILCIDASYSMGALDMQPRGTPVTRLAVVKRTAEQFIRGRKNDRIGLIVFGGDVVTLCPLTLDHGTLARILNDIDIGIAGEMTALASALVIGVKRLKIDSAGSKVLVLLTDGQNNAGSLPLSRAAAIAGSLHIKVYTIGVGTAGPVPFKTPNRLGIDRVFQQKSFDEGALRKVADTAGGMYFRASNKEALERIFKKIDKMEKKHIKRQTFISYRDLFPFFVFAGVLVLMITEIISNRLFWKVP